MDTYKISSGSSFVLERLNDNNEEGYIVGGSVRDLLMGSSPSDFDVTTSASPEKIEEIFYDCKLITLGKDFGTIGIIYKGELIETTTFRKDGNYLDGRHPESVEYSNRLVEDLKRRDFTINAMAMELNGNIIDEFNGREDLEKKTIKAVGDPKERFEEDKLRMLRAVRFANRFNFKIQEDTLNAIKEKAYKINQVSKERIQQEINKILLSDTPSRGFEILLETRLLENIFPELMPTVGYDQMSPYHHKDLFKHMLCTLDRVKPKIHLRLAAVFHDIAKVNTLIVDEKGVGHFFGHDDLGAEIAEKILKRLKYDNKTIKNVKLLIEKHMSAQPQMGEKGLKRLINRVGEDLIFDLTNLMISDLMCTRDDRDPSFLYQWEEDIRRIIDSKSIVDKSGLAINGHDLIEIGYNEGREIGKVLDELTELALDNESLNNKESLIKIAKKKLSEEI